MEAVGASVFSVCSEVRSVAEGIQALDARLSWVETNVGSIASLLCDFMSSVRELKEALPVAGSSTKPAGHEPEETPALSSVPPGESEVEPAGREPEEMAGSSSISPGESDNEPAGRDPEETSDVPPGAKKQDDGDYMVIIRTKATGPSAIPLSPH